MIRSMYSGVAGLRTHQARMDTIGNNIANVNTYGYKAGRTTFRDIYYQNVNSALSPTGNRGGVNPSQVGVGTQVGSVDLLMDNTTLTMTSQTMDAAIDGDGFFQVMDASGNSYFTRAGMLGFDALGNLVDMQGNYVLGINGDPTGRTPASERIQANLPAVPPTIASTDVSINGKPFTISASNYTKDGNLSMAFDSDPTMNDDIVAQAKITSSGILITFNENVEFGSWNEVNDAINDAITAAYGGEHPAGDFTIEYTGDTNEDPFMAYDPNTGLFAPQTLSGKDLSSINYAVSLGSAKFTASDAATIAGGVQPSGVVGSTFGEKFTTSEVDAGDLDITVAADGTVTFTMIIDGQTYEGTVGSSQTSASGKFSMKNTAANADPNDYFEMKRPAHDKLMENLFGTYGYGFDADGVVVPGTETITAADLGLGSAPVFKASTPSKAVGLSGSAISLRNGTEGGPQSINDMARISIQQDGTIVGVDSMDNEITIGRIILATFANAAGLEMVGSSMYATSANSGEVKLTEPGLNNSGKLVSGALELANVDLSNEFSDMITTQRGYQANSRIITVSDSMLEELINLKR